MAQDAAKIHVGAGKIYIGTIAPATGTPPTRSAHTSGVPSAPQTGFIEVGHTDGESTFSYSSEIEDIMSEQAFGIVDSYATNQTASLTFTAQERTYNTLQMAFGGIGSSQVTTPNADLFYAGGIFALLNRVVILTSPRRDNPAAFEVLTLYKAQSVEGIELPYSRTTPSRYKVTLRAVHDTTRNVGDQLFQWYRETA